jgi:hypothetical protein
MMGRVGLGIAMLIALASPVSAADSCPQNQFHVSRTDVGIWSTAPTGSVVYTQLGDQVIPWDAGQSCPEGCYDLPKATIVARGFNYLYGPGDTGVSCADDYIVLGPAAPPLSFEVVLTLHAMIDVEGTAYAALEVPGSPWQAIQLSASGNTELALPVVVAPGTPFEIGAGASAVGGHYDGTGLAEATMRFRGLPAGYVITSCQGYNQQTPTYPATWGAVKAQYR